MGIGTGELNFFYDHPRAGGEYAWRFMLAMNGPGLAYWESLSDGERRALTERAARAFKEPFMPGRSDTPNGDRNIKNAYCVDASQPDGYLDIGMWWDTYRQPATRYYLSKQAEGWRMRVLESGYFG